MDYIRIEANGQLAFVQSYEFLQIPSQLYGFHNTSTTVASSITGRELLCFHGTMDMPEEEKACACGAKMHINRRFEMTLRHLPYGNSLTFVKVPYVQFRCRKCGATKSQHISFKAPAHMVTVELYNYTRDLLAASDLTNRKIAEITGLHQAVVKAIDKQRLLEKYTVDGNKFRKPEATTPYLSIDEFKLHDGHKFATHIIDLTTGHILFIAEGKKKNVVYKFIDFVGQDWMKHVKAVACDMNSDFAEAFKERCSHLEIVYDRFHIIKNFNEKVVSEIRIDEYKRLLKEGETEAARLLKGSKYILTSKRATLQKKDKEAIAGKIISKGSELFDTTDYVRSEGYEARYDELIRQNHLLFTADLIKTKIENAYKPENYINMDAAIGEIVFYCLETKNPHFEWFAKMLMNHHDGIVAYARYGITSGKIEGVNRKIKTLRWQGYGYPDDEYFFLKIMDASRVDYVRNPKSHKFLH